MVMGDFGGQRDRSVEDLLAVMEIASSIRDINPSQGL